MISIASLAAETNAQPYEVAAFLDLGRVSDDHEISDELAQVWRDYEPSNLD